MQTSFNSLLITTTYLLNFDLILFEIYYLSNVQLYPANELFCYQVVFSIGTLIEHILLDYVNTFPHLFISKQYTLCQESERFFWWLSTIFQFMNLSKLHRRFENFITMKRVGGLYSEGHLSTMRPDSSPP